MKHTNIVVQFDGDNYRVFESQHQNTLVGVAHSLDEVKMLLSKQFSTPKFKAGDTYYYVDFGEDFRNGGRGKILTGVVNYLQENYYNTYHQFPPNVYLSQDHAVAVLHRICGMFKDLREK